MDISDKYECMYACMYVYKLRKYACNYVDNVLNIGSSVWGIKIY